MWCVIIPTYNNAGTIREVITNVRQYTRDIIVVNDGCTDDTLSVLDGMDVTVASHARNRGKGQALKTGFEKAREAVKEATRRGYLRQNSVDSLTGKNSGTNIGIGMPVFHFHQHNSPEIKVRMMLKGGGSENMGQQYSLPMVSLKANRDLEGCRKVILDAVLNAQGKGCGPGILGVCIGGDRATGFEHSKEQLLRKLDDTNPIPELAELESTILKQANELGIGPMGFGGKTTLFGVKIGAMNRLPACYFVSVSYMCWAFRRQGIQLSEDGSVQNWLY